jgi:hypothetical protein
MKLFTNDSDQIRIFKIMNLKSAELGREGCLLACPGIDTRAQRISSTNNLNFKPHSKDEAIEVK